MSFTWAKRVFEDPYAIDRIDDREDYGEERSIIIGVVDHEIIMGVYVERGDDIRLISARCATRLERNDYFRRNG